MKRIDRLPKYWKEFPINRLYDWQCVLRLYCKDGQENIMVTEEGRDALDFIIYWYKSGEAGLGIAEDIKDHRLRLFCLGDDVSWGQARRQTVVCKLLD